MSDEQPRPLPTPEGDWPEGVLAGLNMAIDLIRAGCAVDELAAALPELQPSNLDEYGQWLRQLRLLMGVDDPHFTGNEQGGTP